MTIEALVARYGLAAVFLGAGIEGETAVVTGGVLAHQGLMPVAGVAIAASAGSFVADQLFFQLGRHFRDHGFVRRMRARAAFTRAIDLLERYPRAFIFFYRFVYGIRTVSPIAIGTSRIGWPLFVGMNAVAAIIWGGLFATIGYAFGNALERLLGRLHSGHIVAIVAVALVIVATSIAAKRWWRRKRVA